jgi:hypothetical protein
MSTKLNREQEKRAGFPPFPFFLVISLYHAPFPVPSLIPGLLGQNIEFLVNVAPIGDDSPSHIGLALLVQLGRLELE